MRSSSDHTYLTVCSANLSEFAPIGSHYRLFLDAHHRRS
ncbi:hypothethical protein [Ralstonia solanacearum PSI07]|uniref:Hypothethical protein n=1 Tax=Ralstonia solanacearum TaxID=305 RepID=A0A0S4UAH4_RALSL|nr:hypothethical protein [Ralstonia solanacearum PSI07]CUV19245.1 Hypothethical protein [Ralstonia solanacearum]